MADEYDESGVEALPRVRRNVASNPVIPSAPVDAEDTVPQAPAMPDTGYEPPEPGDNLEPPAAPRVGRRAIDTWRNIGEYWNNVARYNERLGKAAAAPERQAANALTSETLRQNRVLSMRDEAGNLVPLRDENNNIVYRTGKGPVSYDDQGKAVQTEWTPTGPKQIRPDENATIGAHADYPNQLYRQNKLSPWEYIGTVDEGLQSKDQNIVAAAKEAKLSLDKRLHSDVSNTLGQNLSSIAQDIRGKAATLKNLQAQLGEITDEQLNQTQGGIFGIGSSPTPEAQAARDRKAQLEKQISDLTSEGYSIGKVVPGSNVANKLDESRRAIDEWRKVSPKELGDLDNALKERESILAENGIDTADDPVFKALEQRKQQLGIGGPTQEETLRKDPYFAPILDARDQLASHQDAITKPFDDKLGQARQEIELQQNQIAPQEKLAGALMARLESTLGMQPAQPGEDLSVRLQETGIRIAKLTDLQDKAKVQTILDRLEPILSEVNQRKAAMQPLIDAHNGLVEQRNQAVNSIAPQWQDLQRKFDAEGDKRYQAWVGKFTQGLLQPQDGESYYVSSPDGSVRFLPGHEVTGLQQAVRDGALPKESVPEINASLDNVSKQVFKDAQARALAEQKVSEDWESGNIPKGLYHQGENGQGITFDRGYTAPAMVSAMRDGVLSPDWVREHLDEARKADDDYRALMKAAGSNQKLKAFIDTGIKSYLAFQGGAAASAGVAPFDPELAAAGAPVGGWGAVALPALVHGIAFLAGTFVTSKATDAILKKASKYSDLVSSLESSAQLQPGYATAGEFAGMGPSAVNSIRGIAQAAGFISQKEGTGAAAKFIATKLAAGAGAGAAFEATLRPAFDAAVHATGLNPNEVQFPTFKSIAQAAAIMGILSGEGLDVTFKRAANMAAGAKPESADLVKEEIAKAKKDGVSPEFRAFFGGIDPEVVGTTPEKVAAFAKSLGMEWKPVPKAETGGQAAGTEENVQTPTSSAQNPTEGASRRHPTAQEAHEEIDNLQMEGKTPEEHAVTQNTLRGLVKISQGQPMDALTAAEKKAVLTKDSNGIARVEMVKGPEGSRPVITNAALDRVRQIAPVTAQILPQDEESQRQSILSGKTEVSQSGKPAETGKPEQPTFSVEVETPKGTEVKNVQAPTEEEARTQVAGSIEPGAGMVRDVTEVHRPVERVETEDFTQSVLRTSAENKGSELTPEETKRATVVSKVLQPHYERWQKAFDAVNATLQGMGSGGLANSDRKLVISVPDVISHAQFYKETPEHAGNLMLHEAAHSVTTAAAPEEVIKLWKEAPESLKKAMKQFYKATGDDYGLAHEYWAYFLAGQAELAAGRRIRLAGKFLPEQSSRKFIVENRKALARVLRFIRNSEAELRRAGKGKEFIKEWKKLENLFTSKIKEVDAHAKTESGQVKGESAPKSQISGEPTARGPPTERAGAESTRVGSPEAGGVRERSETPRGGTSKHEAVPQTVARAVEPATRAELTQKLNVPEGAVGHQSRVSQNNRTVEVAFVAQPAEQARPSHNEIGQPTPGYDQSLQPRDRSLPQYRRQSQNIAQNLEFEKSAFFPDTNTPATTADLGAPIMTREGDTIVGNGREIGILQAYKQNTPQARKYKAAFVKNAAAFGIDPNVVRAMKNPVLKRVLISSPSKDELVRFSQESNEGVAMGQNATELANRDASRLTPELLSDFDPNYALDSSKNREFLRNYLREVVRTGDVNEANINWPDLARRVRSSVFTYAYGADEAGRSALDRLSGEDSTKKITNALLTVAPIVARMKSDISSGRLHALDISPSISRATQDISEALRNKPKGQSAAVALDALVNQGEMLVADPETKAVRDFLIEHRNNRAEIEEALSNYVQSVYEIGNPQQGTLFGEQPAEAHDRIQLWNLATRPEAIAPKTEERRLAAQSLRKYIEGAANITSPAAKIYQAAEKAKPELERVTNEVAAQFGARAITAPLKRIERATAKVMADYNGDWSKIKDIARSSIEARTLSEALKVVAELEKRFGPPKRNLNQVLAVGYRDALFNPVINGHTVEIQVHVAPILHAKTSAHKFYERQQEIERRAKLENRQLSSQELKTHERLTLAQRRIYEEALGISSTASEGLQGTASLSSSGVAGRGEFPSNIQAVPSLPTTTPKAPFGALSSGTSIKDLAFGNRAIASSSVIPPSSTAQPLFSQRVSKKIRDTGTLDLFGNYADTLPAAAKVSKPALKAEVQKDVPAISENKSALDELWEIAQESVTKPVEAEPIPFQVHEDLVMHSPHTGEDVKVNYRGKVGTDNAMVWTGRSQFAVPMEWLRRPDQQNTLTPTSESGIAPSNERSTGGTGERALGGGETTPVEEPRGTVRDTGAEQVSGGQEAPVVGGSVPQSGQRRLTGGGGGGREEIGPRSGGVAEAHGGGEAVSGQGNVSDIRPEPGGGTGAVVDDADLVERPLPSNPSERNHVIEKGDTLAPVGNASKYRANIDAIRLLRQLGPYDNATPEQKKILAQYTGWGWAGEYFNPDKPAYAKQYAELKDLLTPEEFASAKASTLNAHYTARPVIESIWDMVRKLGFEGGTVLEPSGGVGHFFGLMPQDLARKSELKGVELDKLSGSIFKKLYPESEIQIKGFQEASIPNNSVDLAISNVPFGDYKVPGARDYPNLFIHDYFFARSLDKVRPGGLVAFVTSDGTMDKSDKRVRDLLSEKADLVGAVRLPNNAFKEAAGTEVTTDILLFRKKDGSPYQGEPFKQLATVGRGKVENSEGKEEEKDIRVNEYYQKHPEMALGEHTLAGTMYGGGDYALVARPGQDTAALLQNVIPRLPSAVIGPQRASEEIASGALAQSGQREGSTQIENGEFRQVVEGRLVPAPWLTQKNFGKDDFEAGISQETREKREQIARDWLDLREATNRLYDAENHPDADPTELALMRKELNRAYDKYVKRWGTLNKRPGQAHNEKARFLEDDPDYPLLQGLENERREINPKTGKEVYHYDKADIFQKRIRMAREMPTTASDVPEALALSLGYNGKIDPNLIGKLLGIDAREAVEKIVSSGRAFENPESGQLETRERYLSGNVRKKLRAAEQAAEDDPRYSANVEALRAALPERIPLSGIYYNLGSRWMPVEVYRHYASEILGSPTDVRYVKALNGFTVRPQNPGSVENTTTWATNDFKGSDLLTHGLNLTQPEVKRNVGTSDQPTWVRDDVATEAARTKLTQMKANFQSWLKTTTATTEQGARSLQEHVEDKYNEANNAMVAPEYSGDYLVLPGLSETVNRLPHRLSVIARVLQEGSAMMAHGVGSGKTFSQIVIAKEMRRLGLSKKPMIVVQKATIGQFAASYRQAYPDARILVATEKSFEKANRRRFMARIASGDYDSVIVTQPQFDRIPSSEYAIRSYFNEKLDALDQAIRDSANENGKRDPTTKRIEKAKMRLEEKMQKRLDALKRYQDYLPFENLGVDSLLIDEAHAYKRAPITTNMRNVKGVPNDESQRAMGLEMKTRHVQQMNNGRNVILATGTPITNTMAEAYVMLKLATPNVLQEYGIENFDDFASLFGVTQTKLEYTWGGNWKLVTRFNKFVNGAELITMIRSGFDVKMGNKELGLKVPKQKGPDGADAPELVIVPQTEEMSNIADWITTISDTWDNDTDKREHTHIPIVTMQAGMAASLDPRLIDPSLPDNPHSKVNKAIERILDIYHQTTDKRLTQVVFADRFKPINTKALQEYAGGIARSVDFEEGEEPTESFDIEDSEKEKESELSMLEKSEYKSGGFNLYHDIKNKLIAKGVPASEVAIIHDYNTDLQRQRLFDEVNSGKVRIIIGSTEKLGVGVNMQTKLVALHHLDPPRMMTPAMMEQRDGRGVRQGNTNKEIWNIRYGSEKSMDTGIYQMLENKGRFIHQALMAKGVGRTFDDAADEATLSMAEMKALLTGDTRVLRKAELEGELTQMTTEKAAFEDEQSGKAQKLARERSHAKYLRETVIPRMEADAKSLKQTFIPDALTATIRGEKYTSREAIVAAIDSAIRSASVEVAQKGRHQSVQSSVFTVGGLPMAVRATTHFEPKSPQVSLEIFSPSNPELKERQAMTDNGQGMLQSAAAYVRNLPKHIAEEKASAERAEKTIPVLEQAMKETWPREEEYKAKLDELHKLELSLLGKDKDQLTATGDEANIIANTIDTRLMSQPIRDRFNEELPLALKIAGAFRNVKGGFEREDLEQHARIALARAAEAYNEEKGPFRPFAAQAIRNELRALYTQGERKKRIPSTTSLDQGIEGREETGKDLIPSTSDVRGEAAMEEGRRVINESVSQLPQRMQSAINGILEGRTLDDIGSEMGVSKQAVSRLAIAAMRRLKGKLGELGISKSSDLFSQPLAVRRSMPANTVVADVRDFSGEHLGIETRPYDGTPEDAGKQARALRDTLDNKYGGEWSNIQTTTGATAHTGEAKWIISPNGLHVSEVGTRAARYTLGDLSAADPKAKAVEDSQLRLLSQQLQMIDAQVKDALKSQSSTDPLQQLIDTLDTDELEKLFEQASAEERGSFKTGRPDLAMGAGEPSQRAVDQYYSDLSQRKSRETMAREGEAMVKEKGIVGFANEIASRWLSGDTLRDSEVMAAKSVLSDLSYDTSPEGLRRMFATGFAYRNIRGQTARDLAAGFDPHKSPEERNREFLAKVISTLPPEKEAQIAREPDKAKKRELLNAAIKERLDKLEKAFAHLSKGGVSIEDIMSGGWELHGKGKEFLQTQVSKWDVPRQKAIKLAQTGTRSAKEIAKETGLSEKEVNDTIDQFNDQLEKELSAKVAAGLTYEKMNFEGALLSQPTKSPEEIRAEVRKIMKGMGYGIPAHSLGSFKVVKRKRPKLFVPPKVARKVVETPEDIARRENAPTPYPLEGYGQPPYTGRVLGQPGLPLYQEMIVKKGADVGSIDDVAKLARVAQAVNGNPFDMAYEAWVNGILSGPQTHIANITGNALSMALDFSLQRGMEALVNLLYRDANSPQFGEFKYLAKGVMPGLTKAITNAARAWQAESDFFAHDVLNQQVEAFEEFEKGGSVRPSIPGKVGRAVRMPARALMAMDSAFKSLIGHMEVLAVAYRMAKSEGLEGDAMSRRMNELVATPGSAAWMKAADKARYLTFQDPIPGKEEGGNFFENAISRVVKMRNGSHSLGFFLPFIRTPYNIFKMGLRKTPLGTFNMAGRFAKSGFYRFKDGKPMFESYPKAQQIRDLAEQLIAWLGLALFWGVTTGDDNDESKPLLFTGSFPRNETKAGEKALMQRAYGGEYQMRIGGRNGVYINYGRYEPIATVLGTAVDMMTILKKMRHGASLRDSLDSFENYLTAQAENKTFLQGFGEISDLVRGKTGLTDFAAKQILGAIVPNIIRQPLRNLDDWIRDTSKSGLGYQMLPAGAIGEKKTDVYGQPIKKGGFSLARMFFPSGTQPYAELEQADKLLLNWNRQHPKDVRAPNPPSTTYQDAQGKTKQMTPAQATKYQMESGKRFRQLLRGRFTTHQVEHPTEDDVKLIESMHRNATQAVKEEMFPRGGTPQASVNFREMMWGRAA